MVTDIGVSYFGHINILLGIEADSVWSDKLAWIQPVSRGTNSLQDFAVSI